MATAVTSRPGTADRARTPSGTRTRRAGSPTVNFDADHIAPTQAEAKIGIIARRRVRATGHIVERIDGSLHPLGVEGGRWIIRRLKANGEPYKHVSRFETRKSMTEASRKA